MVSNHYFHEVDVVKGITILLVILGHCFCTTPINLFEELPILGNVVRSFQMPLFFVVSGFLFSTNGGIKHMLKKKTLRLLLPYLVFGLISICLRFVFSAYTNQGDISICTALVKLLLNGGYYWFLYTLILIMIIIISIVNKFVICLLSFSFVILCLFTDIRSIDIMTIGKIVYYLPFFSLGFCLKTIYPKLWVYYDRYNIFYISITLVLFTLSFVIPIKFVNLYARPILGIIMVWILARIISNKYRKFNDKISTLFSHFGRYSLQYYLNHMLIMLPFYKLVGFLPCISPIISLLTIFICAVITSYMMLKIEQRFKLLCILSGLK